MSVDDAKTLDIPPVQVNFHLKPNNLTFEEISEEEYAFEKNKYHCDLLNPGQREIYDYVHNNPNDIVVIQAAAGTGKTFTLKTIAHSWGNPVNVIIYKHDLLDDFPFVAVRHTVTKFFMNLFQLSFDSFKTLEYNLNHQLNSAEFLLTIVNLLSKAEMPNFQGSLVILDEYTVVSKPLLLILLMLLKHYKIGTILCGNKYQLQNIPNSEHMGSCSSFDIASYFRDEIFILQKNERCSNSWYNKIVEHMSTLSSEKWFDDFGKSMITAVFPKQVLFGSTTFSDTHVAGSHQELTDIAQQLVLKEKHKISYYAIENEEGNLLPCKTFGRFLPYLPLVIGSTYYVDNRSEHNKAELATIEDNRIEMRSKSGNLNTKVRNTQSDVIFKEHLEFLEDGNFGAKISNFPIYPANFLTIHKCQGSTIRGSLDIKLESTTYQGAYVAVSRVQDPSQIVRVTISNPLSHLVSCIVNFPELVDPDCVTTAEMLKLRMKDYKYYYAIESLVDELDTLVHSFFEINIAKNRENIRNLLLVKVSTLPTMLLNPPLAMEMQVVRKNETVYKILKYKEQFIVAACMEKVDRCVWLKEFLTRSLGMTYNNENQNPDSIGYNMLYDFAGLENMPGMECDMISFILKHSKITFKNDFRKDEIVGLEDHHIEELPNSMVRTTTPFCKAIYDKYKNGLDKEITTQWLVDFLNKNVTHTHSGSTDKVGRKRLYQEANLNEDSGEKKSRI